MEIRLRLFGAVQLLLSWVMAPYYFIIDLLPVKYCPKIKNDVLKLSMTQLAAKIRSGELKSSHIVKSYIARIREVDPLLNAVTDERFAEAMKEAEAVDRLIESKSKSEEIIEKETPLLGVPVSVKESCQVKGLAFAIGNLPRKGIKGEIDGAAVANVKNAGAIVMCVSNTPEFCLSWESNNLVHGATRNPYNTNRSAGGSSGGEGALIGSAASIGGLGSDIGGSIRIPALNNGVFGHKPTPHYVPMEGHHPWDESYNDFLVIGPLVRYSEDLPLMMRALVGPKIDKLRLDEPVDLKKLNVFYQETSGFSLVAVNVDEDIAAAVRRAALTFHDMGCKIKKTEIPLLSDSIEIAASLMIDITGIPDILATSTTKTKDEQNLFTEVVKSHVNMSEYSYAALMFTFLYKNGFFVPKKKRPAYKKLAAELKAHFVEMLGDNGVFFYPTFPLPAVHHNETFNTTAGVMYSLIVNALGLPSTHVPMGLGRHNLPIGFQVVAGPHQDRLCFAVARELEKQHGGWVPPPYCN